MRRQLLLSTAALLATVALASAQNMPGGQSQGSQGGAASQHSQSQSSQGRGGEAQRGAAQEQRGAQEQGRQGQAQRGEAQGQRGQTTGQAQQREQSKQGQAQQQQREQSKQGQAQRQGQAQQQREQSKQGQAQHREQSKQGQAQQRGQRDQTTGQAPSQTQQRGQQDQMGQQPQQRQQTQQPQQGQTQQGQAAQGQGAQGQVNLTPQQRTQISQTVLSDRNVPRVNNVNFALSVGTVVPARVRFAAVPAALIEINPAWRGHEFFVVQDDIVIVDNSRKIVAMVPVGSSGGRVGSSTSIRGGATAGAMDLSVDEIRQVQMVLVDKGFDVEVDGRLGPRTRQALIAFQRQQGLSATGTIDHQTVGALGVSVHGMQGGAQGATTGQGGMQQQPNQAPAGGAQSGQTGNQPSTNGQGTQQPSANPPAASGGQRSQSGSQPSTAGQGSRQQPSANENNMNQNNRNIGGSSNPSGADTPAQQPK